jgi:hypothetical protein
MSDTGKSKKEEYAPPKGWANGKLLEPKDWIEYFYDDEMCQFIDDSVKPGQIRSSLLNEINADRKMEARSVLWDKESKKAISIIRKGKKS